MTSHIHSWVFFLLWLHPFILSGVISPLSLVAYWAPTDLGRFSFSILSFCLFILFGCAKAQAAETGTPKRGREELPHVRGQGQQPRVPDCDGAGMAQRSYPMSEVRGGDETNYPTSEVGGGEGAAGRRYPTPLSPRPGAAVRRSYPTHLSPRPGAVGGLEQLPHASTPEARGGGREDQPQAMAAQAQEGLEELSHVEGQKGWR